MSEPKICPECGTPQQWRMWRYCGCGHDFGSSKSAEVETPNPQPPPSVQAIEFFERHGRLFRRVFYGSCLTMLLTGYIPALHWLTSAAAFVACAFFLAPFDPLPGNR